jgi:long-chain acyl-CoA synthetase
MTMILAVTRVGENPVSLPEMGAHRIGRDPDAPFLLTIEESSPYNVRTRTYGDIGQRTSALVSTLAEAGVRRGDRVGCYLPNAPSWVVASFAAWWTGASIAAVGTLLPGPEAARLFQLANAQIVIAADSAPHLRGFHVITVDDEGFLVDQAPSVSTTLTRLPDPEDLAAIFFTSGTTGRPKGIPYSHGDMVTAARRIANTYARQTDYRPDPAPSHLAPGIIVNPFGHTAGFVRLAFRMWIGRPTVLIPKFSIPAMKAYLNRYRPDSLQLTPTMIHMLATSEEDVDLTGVRYVTTSTAPLATPTRELFESRFSVPVMQAYGMTEVGTVAQERLEDVLAGRRGPGSVGRPASGVEVKIRPIGGDEIVDGEGEILVRAKEMPREFIGGAEVPLDGEGWFSTGDVGRLDGGIVYITGRIQEKIIVGGLNVYPAEVEDALKQSPMVADAVVVGLPDDRLGERPVAGIVWAGQPNEAALLEELRRSLAAYKVPRQLFSMEAVPLTPRDKIDRRRCTEAAYDALSVAGPQVRLP